MANPEPIAIFQSSHLKSVNMLNLRDLETKNNLCAIRKVQ